VLATAWVLGDPRVTALVIGPRNPRQLETALEALELRLAPDERDELAELFA
jgi:aryl-alcohol dehydrogenase-like predicted oxidoreductase